MPSVSFDLHRQEPRLTRSTRSLVVVIAMRLVVGVSFLAGGHDALRAEAVDDALETLVEDLGGGSSALSSALREYARIESRRQFDAFGRRRIHDGLLGALGKAGEEDLSRVAAKYLKKPSESLYPAQVLLMKALLQPYFPDPRERRIEYLTEMARGKHYRLSIWGLRLLGDSHWPEAVDALISILAAEESAGKPDESILWHFTSMELFRILGARAVQGGSAAIQRNWEKMERKLPEKPVYEAGEGGEGGGHTLVFFGSRISPRSVFLIDTSTSMRGEAVMRRPGGEDPKQPKVEIVKTELERAVSGLRRFCKFNIYSYNATYTPWPGPGALRLFTASTGAVRSATQYARSLEVSPGTNIHDSLVAALDTPEVESIYLLSDGAPSRGGGPAEIRKRVRALNYLVGARIITYGFAGKGGADESLMQWLSTNNWGWYRRLNK